MENRKQNKKVSEIKNILSKFKRAVIKYRPMTYRGINTGGEQIYERDWCITTSRFYTIITQDEDDVWDMHVYSTPKMDEEMEEYWTINTTWEDVRERLEKLCIDTIKNENMALN